MESGREQNYWPAFVDALSNVVLTLVFVLIIFVFALIIESQKVSEKLEQVTKQENGQSSDEKQENEQLKKQVMELQQEIKQLRQEAVTTQNNQDQQIAVKDTQMDKANQGPVSMESSANGIVLKFPITVAQMDDQSQEKFGHVLEALQKNVGKHKIIMHSYLGKETYSIAQRMAYYRAIGARNYLMQKMGESPDNISMSIVTPAQPEDGRVEIILEKE